MHALREGGMADAPRRYMLRDVSFFSLSAVYSHPHVPILGYFPSLRINPQLSVGSSLKTVDVTTHRVRHFEQWGLLALRG